MSQLIKYEAACRALAECKSLDEVKSWADKAAAMQAYSRMAKDKTMEVDAAEIRIRAERRLGEMLAATKADGGLNPAATLKRGPVLVDDEDGKKGPTLADAGISYDLSSRAQKLAAVPEAEFEAELAAKRERDQREGARVSARLEQSGARHLKKSAHEEEAQRVADEAHGDFDPLAELVAAQQDIERLTAEIRAAEADDQKAETLKWRRIAEQAQRRQGELMDSVKRLENECQRLSDRIRRIGKMVGQDDPTKVPAAVEAFVRAHKAVA